ncbi:DnaJ-class molecular chaperone [Actinoalloteichus hymeniacidonis]|nr:DnaJ-class molecular chaperone [Actinoalloteichus hymeniacidonis]
MHWCATCNGTGTVIDKDRRPVECPYCQGTGSN